jgi:pimeloyl-ACP methyl ester carboxylesterase
VFRCRVWLSRDGCARARLAHAGRSINLETDRNWPHAHDTTTDGIEIYYKDWGSGKPLVFSHGWPLSADDWDAQLMFFLDRGFRVIAADRRGHGRSTQTDSGHDMTINADLLEFLQS